MDLKKAEDARDVLYKLDRLEEELNHISLCRGASLRPDAYPESMQVMIGGFEVKAPLELVGRFLEDLEKDIHSRKAKVFEELTRL